MKHCRHEPLTKKELKKVNLILLWWKLLRLIHKDLRRCK